MLTGLLQPTHLIVLLGIVLVVLGPKRLPGAGRAIAEGLKGFRSSLGGDDDESADRALPAPAPTDAGYVKKISS